MTKEEFYKKLKEIKIELNPLQKEQFENYYKFLNEYNNHTNITAITNKEDVYLKHFYDSALLATTIDFNKITNLLDIGCGAGFPGIVIKILYPNINLTLLDSNNKKTKFCEYIIKELSLKDVVIINKRAEDYINNKREYFDLVTARAVKNLNILNELAIPYVKLNGYFIAMKSSIDNELKESMNGINILGAKYINTISITNDILGLRNFVIIKKIKETEQKYPRNYNNIIKKPFKIKLI